MLFYIFKTTTGHLFIFWFQYLIDSRTVDILTDTPISSLARATIR